MFGSRTKTRSQFEHVANKFYTWKSKEKAFCYYDKESQENIALPDDAVLIPLTATNSVTGVRERDHGKATQRYNNISSNEFVDYKNEIVKVREYDRLDQTQSTLFEGVYSPTIKEAIAGVPFCKFTKNIYCLCGEEVVRLSLSGSSLTAWIEFEDQLKKSKIYLTDGHCIEFGEPEEKVHGSVHYNSPVFKLGDIEPELNAKADEIAAEVEDKLAHNRAAASGTATATIPTKEDSENTTVESDDSIDLSDIPF